MGLKGFKTYDEQQKPDKGGLNLPVHYNITQLNDRLAAYSNVHGVPGFNRVTKALLEYGQSKIRAQRSFAAALIHYGVLDNPKVHVFFGVSLPSGAMVDCVIVSGRRIYLINTEYWPTYLTVTATQKRYRAMLIDERRVVFTDNMGGEWHLDNSLIPIQHEVESFHVHMKPPAVVTLLTRTEKGLPSVDMQAKTEEGLRLRNADSWLAGQKFQPWITNKKAIALFDQWVSD